MPYGPVRRGSVTISEAPRRSLSPAMTADPRWAAIIEGVLDALARADAPLSFGGLRAAAMRSGRGMVTPREMRLVLDVLVEEGRVLRLEAGLFDQRDPAAAGPTFGEVLHKTTRQGRRTNPYRR